MSAKVVLYYREIIVEKYLRFVSERLVMSEDLHFNLNMLSCSKCVCVLPNFFYNYRCTTGSITQQIDLKQFAKIKHLYNYTREECLQLGIIGDIEQRIKRMFIGYTRDYIRNLVRSNTSMKKQREVIHEILDDRIWEAIWKGISVKAMPFKYRLCIELMQKKCIMILMFILKMK